MLISQVSRDDPETIDLTILNVSGTTVSVGMGMRFLGGLVEEVASADGVNATKMNVVNGFLSFAGIALEVIPNNRHGIVRAYGRVESILYSQELNAAIGPSGAGADPLVPGAVDGTWASGGDQPGSAIGPLGSLQSWATVAVGEEIPVGPGYVRAL